MALINKRRLIGLISASAIVATLTVAAAPAATLAAEGDTVVVKGVTLTVMHLNPTATVTGTINANGYDIGVYDPTSVSGRRHLSARSTTASSPMAPRST